MAGTDLLKLLRTALGDRYEVERELARGMSRVFLATETGLGRPVVLKVMDESRGDPALLERFRREIRFLATMQHPHIVPLISAGEVEGRPWFSMPFVEGETLRQRMDDGRLELAEAFGMARDVLKALVYLHSRGVVHRDMKPENVMLSGGVAVVTDFGIAKALQRTAAESDLRISLGMMVGTWEYVAPEQAAGDAVDARTDLYSFAVLAYEALCGQHPFAGKKGAQLLQAHMLDVPVPVKERAPEVPRLLSDALQRALAKAPEDRPASASHLLEVFDQVASPRRSLGTPIRGVDAGEG